MNNNTLSPKEMKQKQKLVKQLIKTTGIAFICVGVASFLFPPILEPLFGDDREMISIFAGILVFVGIADIVVATKFLFREDTHR